MTLADEIAFWQSQIIAAKSTEAALLAFGIKAGLQFALDHADEITINRINQLGWPFAT